MYNNSHLGSLSEPLASIDKLTFSTSEFEIANNSPITISPHITSLSGEALVSLTPLFTIGTNYIYGKKAYINDPHFNLTIKVDHFKSYLQFSFNPNKLFHPYLPCSFDQALDSITYINSLLRDNGVYVDLESLDVIRLDLMKQKKLNDPLSAHHTVLSSLRAKRQYSRTFDDTYVIGNTQHETIFYDKSNESKLDTPNVIRCEIRAKRKKTVSRLFSIESVNDLMSSNGDKLTTSYNSHLYANVFTNVSTETRYQTEAEILKRTIEKYGQNGVPRYFMTTGVDHVMSAFGSLDNIKKALQQTSLSDRKIRDWINTKIPSMYQERASMLALSTSHTSRLLQNIYSFAS
jgi:hypothetical protein